MKDRKLADPEREIWDTADVCAYLNFSAPTVRKLVKNQQIPHIVFDSGPLRFRQSDVKQHLEEMARGSRPKAA